MLKNTYKIQIQILFIVLVIAVGLFFILGSRSYSAPISNPVSNTKSEQKSELKTYSLSTGSVSDGLRILKKDGTSSYFKIILADTPMSRERGLSGRISLDSDTVMLFVFENSSLHNFWMKDMLFSIDMVWLDTNRKIIHIERSVKPETYPKSFGPDEDSKYVLEFKEGAINTIGLEVGDQVEF